MPATGTRDTSNLTARKYDVSGIISLLNVNEYPLMAILTNAGKDIVTNKGKAMKKVATTDPEFKWYEDAFGTRTGAFAASQTGKSNASAMSIVVATGTGVNFSKGDVIYIPSLKYSYVLTAEPSTDTLTLSAELGGDTTGSLDLSSLVIWITGNANEEGAGLRAIKGTTPTEKVGYTQIFRTPFGVTRTSKNTTTLIKENDLDYQRRKKGIEHATDIERAFLFGKLKKDVTGSKPKRFTQGIINAISTHTTANVDTEAEFDSFLEGAFTDGNTEKYALCSAAFMSQVDQWAKNKLTLMQSPTTYGVRIVQYTSTHGTINFIKHKMLSGVPFGNYCIVLDMEELEYRYLQDSDTKLLTNRQNNGDDEIVEEYLSEVGLKIGHETKHAIASKGAL
jgi:hypothetical protein